MARPKGTKYIETPQRMWELFLAYKTKVKSDPIKVEDWVGGMGKKITRKKEKPLTMEGFELYCFETGIIDSIDQYFSNADNRYSDYMGICSRVKKAIKDDQITGGMAGIYTPSITQRLNGLVESQKVEESGQKTIVVKYADRDPNNPQ